LTREKGRKRAKDVTGVMHQKMDQAPRVRVQIHDTWAKKMTEIKNKRRRRGGRVDERAWLTAEAWLITDMFLCARDEWSNESAKLIAHRLVRADEW
jgi:hypothetical protein